MSIFSDAFRALLDDTKVFSRDLWGKALKVEPFVFTWFTADLAFPSPEMLRKIEAALRFFHKTKSKPFLKWKIMLERPAKEVTPFWKTVGSNVGTYMLKPCRDEFLKSLSALDPKKQEIMLQALSEMVHGMSQRGPREWSPRFWKEWREQLKEKVEKASVD